MNAKKLIAVLLLVVIAITLSACGGDSKPAATAVPTAAPTEAPAAETAAEPKAEESAKAEEPAAAAAPATRPARNLGLKRFRAPFSTTSTMKRHTSSQRRKTSFVRT